MPVVKTKMRGIPIDFLLASLDRSDIPEDLELQDNKILANLDEQTVRSLGGASLAT